MAPSNTTPPVPVTNEDWEKLKSISGKLYTAYCIAVGGKAFNGDPLPDWETFRADPTKKKQSDAWLAVGRAVFDHWKD